MALIFSQVTLKAQTDSIKLLCSGKPQSHEDLSGWRLYQNFIKNHPDDNICVDVDTRICGVPNTPTYDATPEEIAYFYLRIGTNPDFIQNETTPFDSKSFSLTPEDRIDWLYEISEEIPEILGSGSTYRRTVQTYTMKDALAALKENRNHMIRQRRIQDGWQREYYDISNNTWS